MSNHRIKIIAALCAIASIAATAVHANQSTSVLDQSTSDTSSYQQPATAASSGAPELQLGMERGDPKTVADLKGKKLTGSDGQKLGTISDFVIEVQSGRIAHVVVEASDDQALAGGQVRLVPHSAIQSAGVAEEGMKAQLDKSSFDALQAVNKEELKGEQLASIARQSESLSPTGRVESSSPWSGQDASSTAPGSTGTGTYSTPGTTQPDSTYSTPSTTQPGGTYSTPGSTTPGSTQSEPYSTPGSTQPDSAYSTPGSTTPGTTDASTYSTPGSTQSGTYSTQSTQSDTDVTQSSTQAGSTYSTPGTDTSTYSTPGSTQAGTYSTPGTQAGASSAQTGTYSTPGSTQAGSTYSTPGTDTSTYSTPGSTQAGTYSTATSSQMQASTEFVLASELKGKEVRSGEQTAGTIEDIAIDLEQGKAVAVFSADSSFAGTSAKFHVPFSKLKVKGHAGETVTTTLSREDFTKAEASGQNAGGTAAVLLITEEIVLVPTGRMPSGSYSTTPGTTSDYGTTTPSSPDYSATPSAPDYSSTAPSSPDYSSTTTTSPTTSSDDELTPTGREPGHPLYALSATASAIRSALANDPTLSAEDIRVQEAGQKIMLHGNVSSEQAKNRIESLARSAASGIEIDNKIKVEKKR